MKAKLTVLITVFTLLCTGLILYEKETEKEDKLLEFDNSEADSNVGVATGENSVYDKEDTEAGIAAYICGEVYEPGVYKVDSGARIIDVINLCGGATENAALDFLNLAELVTDGMKIYVPCREEVEGISPMESNGNNSDDSGLININSADVSELTELPGIGETKAQSIIEYRKEIGGFNKAEDILNVNGIGNITYEKIKNLICI